MSSIDDERTQRCHCRVRQAAAHQGVGRDRLRRQLAGRVCVYGGNGTTASSAIVYEVEPGKRLGWHTDATEETQYIIAGSGKLYLEDGTTHQVGPGSVFVLPTPMRTISRISARKRCARSRSSPRRCSRKTLTR